MKSIDLKRRLNRNRPMTSVTIRIPKDVIEDLKGIAPQLGPQSIFSDNMLLEN